MTSTQLMRPMLAAALLAATALAGVAHAQDEENMDPAVKARHAHMQLYAFNLGKLGAMAKGEAEYDAEVATGAAANLAQLTQLNQATYWVEGTSSDDVEGSKAKPELFQNMDDYMSLTEDLHQAAMSMETAAGESAEAIGAQMGALGGACGACHKKYRVSDD